MILYPNLLGFYSDHGALRSTSRGWYKGFDDNAGLATLLLGSNKSQIFIIVALNILIIPTDMHEYKNMSIPKALLHAFYQSQSVLITFLLS